jgi:hypothetical protein
MSGPQWQELDERLSLDPGERLTEEEYALLLPERQPVRLANVTELLGLTLLVVSLVWLVFVRLPAGRAEVVPELTAPQTGTPELFETFEARRPSLYLTLAPGTWEDRDAAARVQLLASLERAASEAGYAGILVRDPSGRPVARWLESRGVELIDSGE